MKKISLVLAVLTGGALIAFSGTASAEKGYKKVPSSALHQLNKNIEIARKRLRRKKKSGPSINRKAHIPCRQPHPPKWCSRLFQQSFRLFQQRKFDPWPEPDPREINANQMKGNMKAKTKGMMWK
jgi:hypothetical protein